MDSIIMQVGYTYNPILYEKCPICGNNIVICKKQNDFACADVNCALGHGAKKMIQELNRMVVMISN